MIILVMMIITIKVSFKNALIIMTSNVGAKARRGTLRASRPEFLGPELNYRRVQIET